MWTIYTFIRIARYSYFIIKMAPILKLFKSWLNTTFITQLQYKAQENCIILKQKLCLCQSFHPMIFLYYLVNFIDVFTINRWNSPRRLFYTCRPLLLNIIVPTAVSCIFLLFLWHRHYLSVTSVSLCLQISAETIVLLWYGKARQMQWESNCWCYLLNNTIDVWMLHYLNLYSIYKYICPLYSCCIFHVATCVSHSLHNSFTYMCRHITYKNNSMGISQTFNK